MCGEVDGAHTATNGYAFPVAFRDEHEAALQRAAALERERERAEREKERAERELARARLERDNLADELAETKRKLAEAGGEPILSPGDRGAKAAERGRAAALGFVAIMAIAVIGPAVCHSSRSAAPPPPATERSLVARASVDWSPASSRRLLEPRALTSS